MGGEFLEGEFLRGLFFLETIGPANSTPELGPKIRGSKIRIPEFDPKFRVHEVQDPICGNFTPDTIDSSGMSGLSGTGDSRIDSRESFATDTPIFIARQANSHESLEFPIRANRVIRANLAN